MPAVARLQAGGTLRARCGTRQLAANPSALMLRSVGRKAPEKLGCGQSEVMARRVSRATGAKSSDSDPPNTSSSLNAKGLGGASGPGSTCSPAPESFT